MAGQERRDDQARRAALTALADVGQEVRRARLDAGLSQVAAATSIGRSASAWSRLERGEAPHLPLLDLYRATKVVGLDLNVRAYPGGQPLRDHAHLALLERLRSRLGPVSRWHTEVPFPIPGDKRAWDALLWLADVRVGIEAETRVRDAQALQRKLGLKRRDGQVDHLVLLLADTRHHRALLGSVGEGFLADFPVPGAVALARLERGEDPGGSAIILL